MQINLQPTFTGKLPPAPDPANFEEFPQLHEALARYHRAVKLEADARLELRKAARSIESAEQKDAEAAADAIENGVKDPGPKHANAARKQAEDNQRRLRAAQIAADRAMRAVNAAWAEHGEHIVQALKDRLARQREEIGKTLDTLQQQHGALTTTVGLLNTGRVFDPMTGKVRDRSYPGSVDQIAVGQSTERTPGAPVTVPASVAGVIEELRKLGGPLDPDGPTNPAQAHRPPLERPVPEHERRTPRAVRRMPQQTPDLQVDGVPVVIPSGRTEADEAA